VVRASPSGVSVGGTS